MHGGCWRLLTLEEDDTVRFNAGPCAKKTGDDSTSNKSSNGRLLGVFLTGTVVRKEDTSEAFLGHLKGVAEMGLWKLYSDHKEPCLRRQKL